MSIELDLVAGADNVVELSALTNDVTEEPVTDAVVTLTITERDGTILLDEEPMPYVALEQLYRCTVPAATGIVAREVYTGLILATGVDGTRPFPRTFRGVAE